MKELINERVETKMKNNLMEAANVIKKGGTVIFPTETVYAIGANAFDEEAVEKIYKAKNRKRENPINLLVSNIAMIDKVARDITDLEYRLIKEFFPGPLTIILKKRDCIPDIVTARSSMVGVRMPDSKTALELVQLSNVPIAAPSANISGKPSGTNIEDIKKDFEEKVDYIIDEGESKIGIESTIIKVIDEIPHILRPGMITKEQIGKISGKVILDYENKENKELPSSNLKHYSLKTKSILIYDKNNEIIIKKVNDVIEKYNNPVVLSTNENSKFYNTENIIEIGSKSNLKEISKNIFRNLRRADSIEGDIIIIEGIEETGLGIAIMNRLRNVCM